MTTSKNIAVQTAAPKALTKAQATKLSALLAAFVEAGDNAANNFNEQRLAVMAMAQVAGFDSCWPTVEAQLGALWSDMTLKVSKSFLKRYWTAVSAGVAFPDVGSQGWQGYAKGALADALRESGDLKERAPRAGGTAPSKAASKATTVDKDDGAQAATVIKAASVTVDTLIQVINALKANTENRAVLAILANMTDDTAALKLLM